MGEVIEFYEDDDGRRFCAYCDRRRLDESVLELEVGRRLGSSIWVCNHHAKRLVERERTLLAQIAALHRSSWHARWVRLRRRARRALAEAGL